METEINHFKIDHDLLVSVSTKLDRAIEDIKELKDGMAARITALEQNKLDIQESTRFKSEADAIHDDHEGRIRTLESWGWKIVGAVAVIEPVIAYFIMKMMD